MVFDDEIWKLLIMTMIVTAVCGECLHSRNKRRTPEEGISFPLSKLASSVLDSGVFAVFLGRC